MKKSILAIAVASVVTSGAAFADVQSVDFTVDDSGKSEARQATYAADDKVYDAETTQVYEYQEQGSPSATTGNYSDIESDFQAKLDSTYAAESSKSDPNTLGKFITDSGQTFADRDAFSSSVQDGGYFKAEVVSKKTAKDTLEAKKTILNEAKSFVESVEDQTSGSYQKTLSDGTVVEYNADTDSVSATGITEIDSKDAATAITDSADALNTLSGDENVSGSIAEAQESLASAEADLEKAKEYVELVNSKTESDNPSLTSAYQQAVSNVKSAKQQQADAEKEVRRLNQATTNNETLNEMARTNAGELGLTFTDREGVLANNQAIHQVAGYAEENRGMILNNQDKIKGLRADFEQMADEFDDYQSKTNGAIAGVAAMGQIAQPYGVGKANFGVGVANYDSEQAIAVGMGYRYSETVSYKGAVSANTGEDMEPVIAASVNWEF